MRKFIKDLFTGKDNETWNLARVGWATSLVVYLGLVVWDVAHNHNHFDMQSFGTGLGLVMVAGGASVGLQAKTEPGVGG